MIEFATKSQIISVTIMAYEKQEGGGCVNDLNGLVYNKGPWLLFCCFAKWEGV
jgi:hypothetical protein